jgi:hypothetical protein
MNGILNDAILGSAVPEQAGLNKGAILSLEKRKFRGVAIAVVILQRQNLGPALAVLINRAVDGVEVPGDPVRKVEGRFVCPVRQDRK